MNETNKRIKYLISESKLIKLVFILEFIARNNKKQNVSPDLLKTAAYIIVHRHGLSDGVEKSFPKIGRLIQRSRTRARDRYYWGLRVANRFLNKNDEIRWALCQ